MEDYDQGSKEAGKQYPSKRKRAKGVLAEHGAPDATVNSSRQKVDASEAAAPAARLDEVAGAEAELKEKASDGVAEATVDEESDAAEIEGARKAFSLPILSLSVSGHECLAFVKGEKAEKFADGTFDFTADVEYKGYRLRGTLPRYYVAPPLYKVRDWDPHDEVEKLRSFDEFMGKQPNGVITYVGASGSGKSTSARHCFVKMTRAGRKSCFISYGESYFDQVNIEGVNMLVTAVESLDDALKALASALVEGYTNILLDSMRLEVQRQHPEFATGEKGINPGLVSSDLGSINNVAIKMGACVHVPVIAPSQSKPVALALYAQTRGAVTGSALFMNMLQDDEADSKSGTVKSSSTRYIQWSARNLRDVRNVDAEDRLSQSLNLPEDVRRSDAKYTSRKAHRMCLVKVLGSDASIYTSEQVPTDVTESLSKWAREQESLGIRLTSVPADAFVGRVADRIKAAAHIDELEASYKAENHKVI